MNLDTFFEKFDLFADAPNAVAKMRELILDLASQGRLIAQDGAKEIIPLGSILAEASFNGISKGPTDDSAATEILKISAGTSRPDFFVNEDDFKHVKLSPSEIENGRLLPGDLLACRYNGNLHFVGKFSYYRGVSKRIQVNPDKLIRFRVDNSRFCARYVCYMMNSPTTRTLIERMCATTAGNIGLSAGKLKTVQLSFPPLAEQKRIVAKVDELMALCDRLEAQQQQRETRHTALAQASLTRFADAPTPANLELLFHKSYSIEPGELRKSILTLAVQGKLAPRDPCDPAVEELLAISDSRRCHIAQSDRRADRAPSEILSGNDRWEIPEQWSWRALSDIVLFVDYRGVTPEKTQSGVRLITAKNIRKGYINFSPEEYISEETYEIWMRRGIPKIGDVLFTTEAPMGNAAVVSLSDHFALAQRTICFQSYGAIDPHYLVIHILSDEFQNILDKNGTGVTAKGIKAAKLRQLPIAIPPLPEQKRIVAKVEQLMGLVDRLEAQLAESRAKATALLEAVVAELSAAA